MKVSEIMSTDFITIDKDQKLIDALSILRKKKDVGRLIVTQDNKVVGVISFRDVADRMGSHKTEGISPKSMHISAAMSYPIISIAPDADVVDAAKIMLENRISSLVVMEDENNIKGLLKKIDFIKLLKNCKKIKVKDIMIEEVIQITESERVIAARNIMMEKKFSILPVMNGTKIVGIIDDESLADALARFREQVPIKHQKNRIHDFYVGNVMKTDPPTINVKEPLCKAAEIFEETKYKGIFVVDDNENLVGLITLTDITRLVAEEKI
ncbi:MAG: CBS domain-containing protein [Candidatus Heimdallarchaeota archaeon]|nr:CBS domain-containing protein [Candidatus Heimdallarchaeota archaeon]